MNLTIQPYTTPGQFGVIAGEPAGVYHSTPALSNSRYKTFLESPRRYQANHITGEIPRVEKDCYTFGTMFHCAILEPELFATQYRLQQLPPYEGKGAKQIRADYLEAWFDENPNSIPITAQQLATLERMQESVRSVFSFNPGDHRELTFRVKTEFGPLQCRVDLLEEGEIQPWDFKSCENILRFRKDFHGFGYDHQDAFYRYVMEATLGVVVPRMKFIGVEKCPPYETAIRRVTLEEAELARHELFQNMIRFAECQKRDEWPNAYGIEAIDTPAPKYRRAQMEDAAAGQLKGFNLLAAAFGEEMDND